MAKPNSVTSIQICAEHCAGDVRGATEMRAACDAFFRRRGLNIYGGNLPVERGGMAGIIKSAAERGKARKAKRESRRR